MEKTNSNERFRGKDANIDGNKRLRFQKENGKTQLIPIYKNKSVDHGNSPAKWLGFITPDGQTRYIPIFDTWHGNSGSKGEPGPMTTSIGQVCNLCFSNCNKNYVNCEYCHSTCDSCNSCRQGCNTCHQACQSCHNCLSCNEGQGPTCSPTCYTGQTRERCTTCYTSTQCSQCFDQAHAMPDTPGADSSCGSVEATVPPCSHSGCCNTSSHNVNTGCGHCYSCVTCDGRYETYGSGYKDDSDPCCDSVCNKCTGCDSSCNKGCTSSCNSSCNDSCNGGCNSSCNVECNSCNNCLSCRACNTCETCNANCYEENSGYCGPSYDPK